MTIPLTFLTRYAIPLILAAIYLGDVDIPQQFEIFDKTQRLADQALSQARKEGQPDNGQVETFDYIVVGGGSAGAIVANKLSANPDNRVLLLEAGGDPNPIMDVPMSQRFYRRQQFQSMDWDYITVRQNRACGLFGGYCPWPLGKALGGCSSLNGLMYNRCKPADYNRWAEFTEDPSWSWENLKDTFNSFEDYHGFYEDTAGDSHGKGGEMFVGKIDYLPGVEVMEEALQEKGIPLGDLNAGSDMTYGFGKADYSIKEGLRWGTYQAFLEPVLNRTNLKIYRYATAIRVDMEEGGEEDEKRAVGVTYRRHGAVFSAKANKEVILSGGMVGSPKLLLLSGIGPKQELEALGIPSILDLPAVGRHLQDQSGLSVLGKTGGFRVNTTIWRAWNTTESVLQYIQNGTGPLNQFAWGVGSEYISQILHGYLNGKQNEDRTRPDVHVYIHSKMSPEEEQFYFMLELVNLKSRGSVRLATADPQAMPIIDPNLLEDPSEIEILIDVIETMTDIFLNSTTFQSLGVQPMEPLDDLCMEHPFPSRDYWKCYIQERTLPYFHSTSSCRMGPNSTVAVVDSRLKVFGTQNLRVADASVMPFTPSGNTNMPSMLIGIKAAEFILSGQ